MKRFWQKAFYPVLFFLLLALEVLIALYEKDAFVRPYLGDVLAVLTVYCFCRCFVSGRRLLPLWVFLFAALVEISQYFHLAGLLGLSGNAVMRTLLGGTFDWKDILCYGAGALLLCLWQTAEKKKSIRRAV